MESTGKYPMYLQPIRRRNKSYWLTQVNPWFIWCTMWPTNQALSGIIHCCWKTGFLQIRVKCHCWKPTVDGAWGKNGVLCCLSSVGQGWWMMAAEYSFYFWAISPGDDCPCKDSDEGKIMLRYLSVPYIKDGYFLIMEDQMAYDLVQIYRWTTRMDIKAKQPWNPVLVPES